MAVQTIGLEFLVNAQSGIQQVQLLETHLKNVGLIADKINFTKVGQNIKLGLAASGEDIDKLKKQLEEVVRLMSLPVDKTKYSTNPFKDMVRDIKTYQQELQSASNSKLALLEAGYIRAKAIRDKGESSIQAQQAKISEQRIKLEQETQAKLLRIQELSAKGLSLPRAEKLSSGVIQHYHDTTDALNKQTSALEKTKSAHMNLTSFIGTSMIIWRSYNFVLGQTTSLLQAIPKVGMELDSTVSVLKATMGGSAGAAAGLKALDEEAGRTGINIIALRENWRTFSASTVVAGETMDTAWKMFSNVNTVVTALHYSGDKATHIFMALSQMFNKSKVQSEELVKQLGNLLPAAYGMFAKSMGKTTSELAIQMKKGLVFAHDTLPKFLADYEEMFKISFANASKSLNAEVGRMQNEFIKLGEAIYKVTEEDMVSVVRRLKEFAQALGENPEAIKNLIDHIKTLGEALLILAAAPIATKLINFIKFLKANPVSLAIIGIATALVTLKDKLDAIETTKFRNLSEEVANFTKKAEDIKPISIKINIDEDENVKKASQLLKDVQKELRDTSLGFNDTIEKVSTAINLFNTLTLNSAASFARMSKNLIEGKDLLAANTLPYEQMQLKGKKSAETPYLIPEKAFQFNNGKDDKEGSSLKETGFKVFVDKKQFEIYKRELLAIEEQAKKNEAKARQEAIISDKGFTTERLVLKEAELDKISKMELGAIKGDKERAVAEEKLRFEEQLRTMEGYHTKENDLILAQRKKLYAAKNSNLVGEEKDKAIKAATESLAQHEADIKEYQTNVETATKEHNNKLDKINQQYTKKDEELAKKQVELAKKTAEELKTIQETATKDKIREIEKQITALEETKPDLAISSFYDQQIKYLEQEIALKKESLKVTQDTNAELIKTISVNQTPKDVNSLIAAIRGGEARSGAKSYDLYPTGIKGKGGKPASTAKGDMQVLDATYQEMLSKHPEVKEASLESAGKARVLAGEYLLKDLLAYYKDADIAAAAYFSGTGMGTGTKVPVNAAFSKAGVKIGTEDPAELAKVVSILKSDTSNRNGQSIAGYLKTFDKHYGNLDSSSLSAETTALKDNSATLEEIAQIEERISKLKVTQKKEYKSVFEQIAGIHAEYKLFTGEIEQGVEEKSAVKYKDLLKSINLELETANKTEAERNELLKARNEIETIGAIQAQKFASAKAMKSLDREGKSIDKQLATITQMERLNLIDPISAMMQRSDLSSSSLIPNEKKKLAELQGRDMKLMTPEEKDANIAAIEEIQSKLLELSATANESFTFTANMVSSAFDTTFRGILDGTIKGKDAFKEFGKSILKTMQELVLQAIKSQIVGLILKGAGAISGSLMGGSAGANPTGTFATNGIPYKNSNGNVIPFSRGGIPDIGNKFQTFQMANGAAGSLREQGKYEAIMPLKRTANGELGIIAGGGVASNDQRQYNINVNVAGGADETNASDIGHKIAIATMEKIADTRIANASRIGNSQNRTTAFGGR